MALFITSFIVAVLVAVVASFFLKKQNATSSIASYYNDDGCRYVPNIGPGSEDIAVVDNALALVSAGDIDRIYFKSKRQPREGSIFAVRFQGGDVRASKIPIEGLADGERFHPHGISYSNRTDRVYAVSHDCGQERQNEAIEIFRLVRNGKNDENDDGGVPREMIKLVHERTITSPSFPFGSLNDVVEGSYLGELYVTQWIPHPGTSEKCLGNGKFLDEIGTTVNMLFRRKTKVHRCTWKKKNGDDGGGGNADDVATAGIECAVVAEGFKVANGIASDPQREHVYVVDAGDRTLHVFDRNNDDGSLVRADVIALPHGGDNVEYDVASSKLTVGSVTSNKLRVLRRLNGDGAVRVSGGMVTVERLTNGSYAVEEVLRHDGSKLSMISSAVYINGKIMLGSPPSDGILVCPVPNGPPISSYKQG